MLGSSPQPWGTARCCDVISVKQYSGPQMKLPDPNPCGKKVSEDLFGLVTTD